MLGFERLAKDHVSEIPDSVPLIYTQGSEDPVCPAEVAREYFETLPCSNKVYHEFEGMLHEPFNGKGNEQLFDALSLWLEGLPKT